VTRGLACDESGELSPFFRQFCEQLAPFLAEQHSYQTVRVTTNKISSKQPKSYLLLTFRVTVSAVLSLVGPARQLLLPLAAFKCDAF